MNNRSTSDDGINIIKEHEGLRLSSYLDSVDIWTIGYGHTGSDVHKGMNITTDQAISFLKRDIKTAENAVNLYVKVPITQNQFDALVSFSYNVGVGAFRSSTLLELLNSKDYKAAAEQFLRWDKGNGRVIPGLTIRRQKEKALFESKY